MNTKEKINQAILELRHLDNADKKADMIDVLSRESSYLGSNREKAYTKYYEAVNRYELDFKKAGNITHKKKLSDSERSKCTEGVIAQVVAELKKRSQDCDNEIKAIPGKLKDLLKVGVFETAREKLKVTLGNSKDAIQQELKTLITDWDNQIKEMKLINSKEKLAGTSDEIIKQLRSFILAKEMQVKEERIDMGLYYIEAFNSPELKEKDEKLSDLAKEILDIKQKLASNIKDSERRTHQSRFSRLINEFLTHSLEKMTQGQFPKLTGHGSDMFDNFHSFLTKSHLKMKMLETALRGIPETEMQIKERKYNYFVAERAFTDKEFKYLWKNPERFGFESLLHTGTAVTFCDHQNKQIPIREIAAYLYLAASDPVMTPYSTSVIEEQRESDQETDPQLKTKLVEASKRAYFSQISDIRREHNEGELVKIKEFDNPSCPGGTEGRLLLKASEFNKITSFRSEAKPDEKPFHLLPDALVDFMIERFKTAPMEIQEGMAHFMGDAYSIEEIAEDKKGDLESGFENFLKFLCQNPDAIIADLKVKLPSLFTNKTLTAPIQTTALKIIEILMTSLKPGNQPPTRLLEAMLRHSTILILRDDKPKKAQEVALNYRMKLLTLTQGVADLIEEIEERTIKGSLAPHYVEIPFIKSVITSNRAMLDNDFYQEFSQLAKNLENEIKEKNDLLKMTADMVNYEEVELIDVNLLSHKLRNELAAEYTKLDALLTVAISKQKQLENLLDLSQSPSPATPATESEAPKGLEAGPSASVAKFQKKETDEISLVIEDKKAESNLNESNNNEDYYALQSPADTTALPVALGETSPHYDPSPKQWALHFLRLALMKDEKGQMAPSAYKILTSIDLMKDHFDKRPGALNEVLIRLNTYFKNYEKLYPDIPLARSLLREYFNRELYLDMNHDRFQRRTTIPMSDFFTDNLPYDESERRKFLTAASHLPCTKHPLFAKMRQDLGQWTLLLVTRKNKQSTATLRTSIYSSLKKLGSQLKLDMPEADLKDLDKFYSLCTDKIKKILDALCSIGENYLIVNIMESPTNQSDIKDMIRVNRAKRDDELAILILHQWREKYGVTKINSATFNALKHLCATMKKTLENTWKDSIDRFNDTVRELSKCGENEFDLSQSWMDCAADIVKRHSPTHQEKETREATIIEQLYRFVLITMCHHLSLTSISAQDAESIRHLCMHYMRPRTEDPLPFHPDQYHPDFQQKFKTHLAGLAAHVSELILTLKPFKHIFNEGFLSLLSSREAAPILNSVIMQQTVSDDKSMPHPIKKPFMLRIAQRDPRSVWMTWIDPGKKNIANGMSEPENFELDKDCFDCVRDDKNPNEILLKLKPDFISILSKKIQTVLPKSSPETSAHSPSFDILLSSRQGKESSASGDTKTESTQFEVMVTTHKMLERILSPEFAAQQQKEFNELRERVEEGYEKMKSLIQKERVQCRRPKPAKRKPQDSIHPVGLFSTSSNPTEATVTFAATYRS